MRYRLSALTLGLALVAGACAPAGPSGPDVVERFCDLWEEVVEAPPAPDNAVSINPAVMAYAEDTDVVGDECTDPGARLELESTVLSDAAHLDAPAGIVLEDDGEVPAPEPEPITSARAFLNREDLGPGQLVLDSVAISALSASIDTSGIRLSGNVAVRLSGVTSTIGFVGTMSSLDNWAVSLSSSALSIPGISSTPVVFSGTLRSINGEPSLTLSAQATAVTIGDIAVNSATIQFAASRSAGVAASVQGSIRIGTSTVNGSVDVNLDRRGNLVAAHADLTTRLLGFGPGGTSIDLQGDVQLDGNADETTVAFSGSGVVGDLIVREANGELELGDDQARFTGLLDIEQGDETVRFNGAIVWDGDVAFVELLEVEAAGEISGTLPNGQRVAANGNLAFVMVDGFMRTVVTGDFTIGSLRASGWATVDVIGATTVLNISAALDLDGNGSNTTVEGVVEISDGQVDLVRLDGAVTADQVSIGDLTLGASTLKIRSAQDEPLDIVWAGSMQIGDVADLSGNLAVSVGPTGSLLSLDGEIEGSFDIDPVVVDVTVGEISATADELTAELNDAVVGVPGADIKVDGTFTSSLDTPDWVLTGSGTLVRDGVDLKLRRVIITPQDGMVSVNVRVTAGIFFVFGDLQFQSGGGCRFIVHRGGPFARWIAKSQIEKQLECEWIRRGQLQTAQTWVPVADQG